MTGGGAAARGAVSTGAVVGIDCAATGAAIVGSADGGATIDGMAAGIGGRVKDALGSATVLTPKPVP